MKVACTSILELYDNFVVKPKQSLRFFGVIRTRISDPRSVWIMVHQRNRRIHDQSGFTGSFDVLDPDRSWITDPGPDHPKGTQPNLSGQHLSANVMKQVELLACKPQVLSRLDVLTGRTCLKLFCSFSRNYIFKKLGARFQFACIAFSTVLAPIWR